MDNYNDMTLDYYNKNAESFSDNTKTVEFEDRQNMLLKYLNRGAYILDLGCGAGRDSKAFIEKGYIVTAMDGSREMCKIASDYIGQEVIYKAFQDLDEIEKYDAVWACASILHVPSKELKDIIQKISRAIKNEGYIYISFKYGNFEGTRNGRYFTDFTEESFGDFIHPLKELSIVEFEITKDARPDRKDEKWLNVIIKKI